MCSTVLKKFLRTCFPHPYPAARFSHLKAKVKFLPYNEIPAARRLPFIGTTLDLIAAGSAPKLHKFIDGRHQQLGPIFREPMGSTEIIFVACPKMMRSVFLYEGQYPTHPLPDSWLIYNRKHGCKRGLFFMDGEEWYNNRRIMNKLLLNGDEDQLKVASVLATDRLINVWKQTCKSTAQYSEIEDLERDLYRWSIDVTLFAMLGFAYNDAPCSYREMVDEFAKNVYKIFVDSSKLMTFPAKIAEFLNLDVWKQFERNVTNVLSLGSSLIDQSLVEFENGHGLLSMMLERGMDLDTVKRIFLDLIIAAGDTTAFSSIWALYSIATNDFVQNEARAELLHSETGEHKYIKGIIRETLRLYPVAPFIGRFLARDAIIGGYAVPKGTLVVLSLYTSGRNEENFIDADKFNPSRWMRNETRELCGVLQAYGTVPFGLGARSCIGRKLAMYQMQSLLERMLPTFKLKCLNEKSVDIILRLIATPDEKIKLSLKLLN